MRRGAWCIALAGALVLIQRPFREGDEIEVQGYKGTVTDIEEHGDDFKVTVRFNTAGLKKLLAKYARLEPA